MIGPIEKKRYPEQIAGLLQEKILRESLPNGFRLPTERQLAEELMVSRTVVREALRILDMSGFVNIKKGPKGGIFVDHIQHKPLSDSLGQMASCGRITVDHLFEVRLWLEPFIAAEATRHASNEELRAIEVLLEDAETNSEDVAYLKGKNIEFHLLLADISGNPVLSILMRSIADILLKLAYNFLNHSFEKELFQVHRDIFHMIKRRRADDVERMVREDILFVKQNLKECVEKEGHLTSIV